MEKKRPIRAAWTQGSCSVQNYLVAAVSVPTPATDTAWQALGGGESAAHAQRTRTGKFEQVEGYRALAANFTSQF